MGNISFVRVEGDPLGLLEGIKLGRVVEGIKLGRVVERIRLGRVVERIRLGRVVELGGTKEIGLIVSISSVSVCICGGLMVEKYLTPRNLLKKTSTEVVYIPA